MNVRDIKVDDEFEHRLPPLKDEEREQLKLNIIRDGGINQPLIVWEETNILVDGHHRLSIYDELEETIREPDIVRISFPDRDAALAWVDRNARGQRNLSPADMKIVVGRIYNHEKKSHGGDRISSGQIDHLDSDRTCEQLADEFAIAPKSVRRHAKRAEVYDAAIAEFGPGSEEAEIVKAATQDVIEAATNGHGPDPVKALALAKKEAAAKEKAKRKREEAKAKEQNDIYCDIDTKLRNGMSRAQVAKETGANDRVIAKIWSSVADDLVATNLEPKLAAALCPPMVAAEHHAYIKARARLEKCQEGDILKRLKISGPSFQRCRRIIRTGIPVLVVRVREGRMAVNTALQISKLPKEEQKNAIKNIDTDIVVNGADVLRRMAATLLEQKRFWEQDNPRESAITSIAKKSDDDFVKELANSFRVAGEWSLRVASILENGHVRT